VPSCSNRRYVAYIRVNISWNVTSFFLLYLGMSRKEFAQWEDELNHMLEKFFIFVSPQLLRNLCTMCITLNNITDTVTNAIKRIFCLFTEIRHLMNIFCESGDLNSKKERSIRLLIKLVYTRTGIAWWAFMSVKLWTIYIIHITHIVHLFSLSLEYLLHIIYNVHRN